MTSWLREAYFVELLTREERAPRVFDRRVVSDPSQADSAILRTDAAFQKLHPNYVFGAMQHEGALGFSDRDKEFEEIKRVTSAVPTIVTLYLDRPAILTSGRLEVAKEEARHR